nr:immunoglobulin heavy chain junction region [Mus musculus]
CVRGGDYDWFAYW